MQPRPIYVDSCARVGTVSPDSLSPRMVNFSDPAVISLDGCPCAASGGLELAKLI